MCRMTKKKVIVKKTTKTTKKGEKNLCKSNMKAGEVAQKHVLKFQKSPPGFVDNAMVYGELAKKIDVFYEK